METNDSMGPSDVWGLESWQRRREAESAKRLEYLEGFVARLEKRVEALEGRLKLRAKREEILQAWNEAERLIAEEAVSEYRENRR